MSSSRTNRSKNASQAREPSSGRWVAGKEEEEEAPEVIDIGATTTVRIEHAAIGEQALVPGANSDNNTDEEAQGPTSGEFETPALRPKRGPPDSAVLPTVREPWGKIQQELTGNPSQSHKEYGGGGRENTFFEVLVRAQ